MQDAEFDKESLTFSNNPLESVRQSMLLAAGYLSEGLADEQTQELQTGIVNKLDELIAELEKSTESNSTRSAQSEQQPGRQQQQTAQQPPQSRPGPQPAIAQQQSSEEPTPSLSKRGSTPDTPGQKGQAENVAVELADPLALQQSVWGQLPEQVRKQMQSRMVERFLPSYRRQIEAYFQALLETQ